MREIWKMENTEKRHDGGLGIIYIGLGAFILAWSTFPSSPSEIINPKSLGCLISPCTPTISFVESLSILGLIGGLLIMIYGAYFWLTTKRTVVTINPDEKRIYIDIDSKLKKHRTCIRFDDIDILYIDKHPYRTEQYPLLGIRLKDGREIPLFDQFLDDMLEYSEITDRMCKLCGIINETKSEGEPEILLGNKMGWR